MTTLPPWPPVVAPLVGRASAVGGLVPDSPLSSGGGEVFEPRCENGDTERMQKADEYEAQKHRCKLKVKRKIVEDAARALAAAGVGREEAVNETEKEEREELMMNQEVHELEDGGEGDCSAKGGSAKLPRARMHRPLVGFFRRLLALSGDPQGHGVDRRRLRLDGEASRPHGA